MKSFAVMVLQLLVSGFGISQFAANDRTVFQWSPLCLYNLKLSWCDAWSFRFTGFQILLLVLEWVVTTAFAMSQSLKRFARSVILETHFWQFVLWYCSVTWVHFNTFTSGALAFYSLLWSHPTQPLLTHSPGGGLHWRPLGLRAIQFTIQFLTLVMCSPSTPREPAEVAKFSLRWGGRTLEMTSAWDHTTLPKRRGQEFQPFSVRHSLCSFQLRVSADFSLTCQHSFSSAVCVLASFWCQFGFASFFSDTRWYRVSFPRSGPPLTFPILSVA